MFRPIYDSSINIIFDSNGKYTFLITLSESHEGALEFIALCQSDIRHCSFGDNTVLIDPTNIMLPMYQYKTSQSMYDFINYCVNCLNDERSEEEETCEMERYEGESDGEIDEADDETDDEEEADETDDDEDGEGM